MFFFLTTTHTTYIPSFTHASSSFYPLSTFLYGSCHAFPHPPVIVPTCDMQMQDSTVGLMLINTVQIFIWEDDCGVREGPDLLEMHGLLYFVTRIIVWMHTQACCTACTSPCLDKKKGKKCHSSTGKEINEVVKMGEITTEETKKWRAWVLLNNHSTCINKRNLSHCHYIRLLCETCVLLFPRRMCKWKKAKAVGATDVGSMMAPSSIKAHK